MSTRAARNSGITPEIVLDKALDLLEIEGVEGFSMRKLAAHLGVAPPTIYWHIGNKSELFDRLLDHITDQLGEIRPRGGSAERRVASVADGLRAQMASHPQLVALAYHQGRGAAIYSRAQEILEHELERAGLSGAERERAMTNILLHVGGFILLDHALHAVEADHPGGRVSGMASVKAAFDDILDAILEAHLGRTSSRTRERPRQRS